MAATKEAIAIILDVGPSMNQAPPGTITSLESAIEGINMILQRKIFAESKDEVALILFGTPDTDNPLDDGESYQNITLKRPLGIADFDLLRTVQSELQPSDTPGDFLDAIVVALDHLEKGLQGKKGFGSRRLILFTDLGAAFGDQELDTIVAAMSNTKTELNVIGPNLDDEDGEGDGGSGSGGGGGGAGPSTRKEKTSQQKSGEALVKHMLDQVNGECYSFSEALPALSYFQSRQIKPMAWKCNLEIGQMEIPINGYSKVKDFKLKQSWKKVYAQDTSITPRTLPTYHMTNEEETEVDREDMVEGYKYGNTIVPMSEDDKDNMKYKAEKCLKVLGFTKAENFKRYHTLGDGVISVTAEKGDEAAAVALSALINALYETNSVAIARRVYDARSSPRLGALFPHIKAKYECLFWVELPFAEDVRTFTFGSLPLTEDVAINKKYKPTDEQLSCMDDLINTMDLSQALDCSFEVKLFCLQHRALHPDDPLPDLSPIIANYLRPPEAVTSNSAPVVERLSKLFKLEVTDKGKLEETGENMFKSSHSFYREDEDGLQAKKPKLDNNLDGGLQSMMKAEVTEVGTVTPIEDFKSLLGRTDRDMFEEGCKQMQKRIQQVVVDSFGQQFYGKAMDCLKALRQTCIDKSGPNNYNEFIKTFKDTLIASGRRDFWDLIVKEQQSLISKPECEASGVTKQEADEFTTGEVKVESSEQPQDEESADDLLDQL
ncbi:X-ray repair cross-complementing protein 5-like [Elysia marginata]|uniref:ATP-dependent DNA helicase II subunit 2 n=1 Tax=Elysia marginata TaxID=1093978 RepID=A0AAV4I2J6_9GAST|nr:X-ray repair cross-complementing protein 5-like [Elysia marginata]